MDKRLEALSGKLKRCALAPWLCLIISMVGITGAYAQSDTLLTQKDAIKLVTTTYEAKEFANDPGFLERLNAYRASSATFDQDKYVKNKEGDKQYSQFEAYDVKGLSENQLALGLYTNTIDRSIRYEEQKRKIKQKKATKSGLSMAPPQNVAEMILSANPNTLTSEINLDDKYYFILGENDYRYLDGKKLVGDPKLRAELLKGKPITEATFFYELQAAGVIDYDISLVQFGKLSIGEKQKVLSEGLDNQPARRLNQIGNQSTASK